MIYLAGPYSHPNPQVMDERARQLTAVAIRMIADGLVVFSPVTLGHAMFQLCPNLPTDAASWDKFNLAFLKNCTHMCVVKIPGWQESLGVQRELELCEVLNIPVQYLEVGRDH